MEDLSNDLQWDLFDSHTHIHDSEFFTKADGDAVYQRAIAAGVNNMLCVGTNPQSSLEAVNFVSEREGAFAAVGVHPHDTKDGLDSILEMIKQNPGGKIKAIGEIGLDYFYNHSPRDIQIKALEQQLQWALDYNLPVSFHVREAYDDFWPIFENFNGIRGVLHSFTDNQKNMEIGLSHGLYIAINGISTFTKNRQQKQLFSQIPLDRLLLETDAPFLTPSPLRGKVNEPAYVKRVACDQASQRNVDALTLASATTYNAKALFLG